MGGSPIPFRNFKISILTVPSTSEQSPLCSSFPTATRCAGLAVGGPPCGRHFSSLRNINFNRPLQKTPEIFGFRVFLAAKFGCFGSREYGFKGRPHGGRGTGEYQDICSCRREHLEKIRLPTVPHTDRSWLTEFPQGGEEILLPRSKPRTAAGRRQRLPDLLPSSGTCML